MSDPFGSLDFREVELLPADAEMPLGLDRRSFLFLSAAAAAASAFGRPAWAQGAAAAAPQQPQQPALVPLGNGEPPAMQYQAYPGGTGALLEKLSGERGRAAFDRSVFTVEKWSGPVPTSEEEIAFLPVHRLAALIQARKISSVALTDIYLNRLKRLDPTLLCAVTILDGQAREAAQQADSEIKAGHYRGPLHGIPWGVKDLFAVKGTRTTWGSADFENRVIDEDSEVVVRLRNAGAVLIAKLATGLFAQGDQWYRGQTLNPWNLQRGSSGSSAGPSSATAAGCVAFGIGTETQGSITSPARECGLSALRPTFGRVSRAGGMVLAWSMDKVGPLCRTIEDCALVFNTIHGSDEKDPATLTTPFQFNRRIDLAKLRIGYDDTAPKEFVDKLSELGANMKPVGARPSQGGGGGGGGGLGVESAAAFESYVTEKAKALNVDLKTFVDSLSAAAAAGRGGAGRGGGGGGRGAGGAAGATGATGAGGAPGAGGGGGGRGPNSVTAGRGPAAEGAANLSRFGRSRTATAVDFIQSQRRRLVLMHQMAEFMKDLDMYVSGSGDVGLTNQTGHPAAVVQYGFTEGENSRPQCTTIIGDLFADDKILSVAHAYQKATNWHTRHPSLG